MSTLLEHCCYRWHGHTNANGFIALMPVQGCKSINLPLPKLTPDTRYLIQLPKLIPDTSDLISMKLLYKLLISLLATFLGLVTLYLVLALSLSLIPVNKDAPLATEGVEIWITTNGVHADFRVPVVSDAIDWRGYLPLQDYPGAHAGFQYIAFGWGDKGFYLNTPNWSDLTLATAVNAILLPSPTAMHVTYYRKAPGIGEDSRRLMLSQEQYQQLIAYIQASFADDEAGNPVLIRGAGYASNDNFYEAEGSYSLVYTCNNWVNEGLRKIGVRTALWSPFDKGIMHHLEY